MFDKLKFIRFPEIEPVKKLIPIIKLTGKLIVSLIKRFNLVLVELFCIPIIKIKNIEELNINEKISFFNVK